MASIPLPRTDYEENYLRSDAEMVPEGDASAQTKTNQENELNAEQIAKLKELALKAIEKAPWPFYLTAFHREATPENILELIAEAERAPLAAAPAPIHETIVQQNGEMVCTACGTTAALAGSQVQAAGDAVDATRYRWLRDPNRGMESLMTTMELDSGYSELKCGDDLDSAIDAAMR